MRRWTRILIAALVIIIVGGATSILGQHLRWRTWLQITRVPRMDQLPLNTAGYTIERLPFAFSASFARGHEVYFGDATGRVSKAQDRDPLTDLVPVGNSQIRPRLLFVSARGTMFVSGDDAPLVRSTDQGTTWEHSHDWSFWRMTEDEDRHILYAGNYSPQRHPIYLAKVFKSADEGKTWQTIFAEERLDHVHSVLWDAKYENLYLTAGDTKRRGQAFSPDHGQTWHWLNAGRKQGHTDVALSEHYVLWGSDDKLGRVLRAPRMPPQDGRTIVWQPRHDVWWIVAEGKQIYAGTFSHQDKESSAAYLIASVDEGGSWQRLLEDSSETARFDTFFGESRRLSADGWLYCATTSGKTYRVRRTPADAR
jgi:photosystem II stability/assembly factor-like uncharacterized protein